MPWKSLAYFRNRFLPESEISDAVAAGNMPLATVAITLPPSAFTDTVNVAGPIGDVTAALQSPIYGAACAGETAAVVACGATSADTLPPDDAAKRTISASRAVGVR